MNLKLPIKTPEIMHKPPETYVFAILGAYPQAKSWLMNNYINFFITNEGKADFWGKDYFYQDCPWLFENHIPRDILKKCISNFQIFCKDSINLGYYVSCMINEKFIYAYKTDANIDHNILIYGFDDSLKVFYIADFFAYNKFEFLSCSYDELERAFFDNILEETEYFETIRLIKFKEIDYFFDLKKMSESIQDHIGSVNLFVKYKKYPYEENLKMVNKNTYMYFSEEKLKREYAFGLDYYKLLKMLCIEMMFEDYRVFHLIYCRMILLRNRIEYLRKVENIRFNSDIDERVNKCARQALISRNLLIKQSISKKKDESIILYIDEISKEDKEISCDILFSMQKYLTGK